MARLKKTSTKQQEPKLLSASWQNRAFKILVRTLYVLLGLVVAVLALVFFSPDYDLYFVKSGSMAPAVKIGDAVIAGPANVSGIQPGDIITYTLGEELITHRVLSVEGNTLITKGDANEDPDSSPVQLAQVKNSYLFSIPYLGYISSFVQTRTGWLLAVILPGVVLVSFLIKDIVKEALKDEKRVKNILKTDQPIKNTAGENDPLKDILRGALQNYDSPGKGNSHREI